MESDLFFLTTRTVGSFLIWSSRLTSSPVKSTGWVALSCRHPPVRVSLTFRSGFCQQASCLQNILEGKKKIHRLDCRQSGKKYTSGIQNGKKINSELQNCLVSCHLDSQSLDFSQTCLRPVWNKDTLNCWIITKLNKKATDLLFLYFMQVMVGENAFFSSCM